MKKEAFALAVARVDKILRVSDEGLAAKSKDAQ